MVTGAHFAFNTLYAAGVFITGAFGWQWLRDFLAFGARSRLQRRLTLLESLPGDDRFDHLRVKIELEASKLADRIVRTPVRVAIKKMAPVVIVFCAVGFAEAVLVRWSQNALDLDPRMTDKIIIYVVATSLFALQGWRLAVRLLQRGARREAQAASSSPREATVGRHEPDSGVAEDLV